MTLPELSIKRHVLAFMLNAVLVLFGWIAYDRIGMDRLPYVELPVVSVVTTFPGANPAVIDAAVTNVIESVANSVPGIEHIQSTSTPGNSTINITFVLEKNVDVAFNEVQAKVNRVLRVLPDEVDPPVVAKVETNTAPIMWLSMGGDRTQQQLNQYAFNVVKKKLETIDGVGEVRLGGRRDRTIRVNLLPARLAAMDVTALDLASAFEREHLQLAGGFLTGETTEYLVKLDLEFHRVDDLGEMIVLHRDGLPVRLKDVAEVEDGMEDYRALARRDGERTIAVGVSKVANTVEIVREIERRLATDILPELPAGMRLTVVSNDAVFIEQLVQTLKQHLIEGTLLAALVVLLFLRNVRSTLIIATAIPVSLFGAIAVMYFAGFTFNSITMLALLLLIGVVVDDAIVVLENIYRHREHNDPNPVSAAINGSREVVFAVLASTLALVCIFAPVIFISGILGQFLRSFAVVVTVGIMVSWFVSLTLTPMLCSRFMQVSRSHGRLYNWLDRPFRAIESGYRSLLGIALRHRWAVVLVAALAFSTSFWFFANIGKAFAPETDEARFFVNFRTPLGSSIDYTDGKLREVEKLIMKQPEIDNVFSLIGLGSAGQVNQGRAIVRLVPRDQRTRAQKEVIAAVRRDVATVTGVRVSVTPPNIIGGGRGESLQFALSAPNLAGLERYGPLLEQRLSQQPGLEGIDYDLQLDLPQVVIEPDRTRANALGISTRDLALAVNMLTGGVNVARFNDEPGDGQRYEVRLKARDGEFTQPADLRKIFLRSRDGGLVRLDSVAGWKENVGPAVVSRFDLEYAANYYANPTVPLGDALATVQRVAAEVLPAGYGIRLTGQAEEFQKTVRYITFAFGLALVLLYMVLASQFNSFLQPLYVMVAQPLAIVGGLAAIWLTGNTLNIYSMIGLVLLVGLVAKNSILLVDLTNRRRAEGMDVNEALREACPIRLRPVLMTSLTLILALLPAAFGLGAGSETNGPLAVSVIGGMITSTLLTLVVVPAVYSLVEDWRKRRGFSAPNIA
jgi:hydrophobic/amphiphilic exporter-1 (mainly G- bacteria), HAE1 family